MIAEQVASQVGMTKAPQVIHKEAAVTAEDVKAMVEAQVKAALDEAMAAERPEVAEPYLWWNLYSFGPFQNLAPGAPLAPHQVIKAGETAYLGTVLVLNPFPILPPAPGMSPSDVLSSFALPYQIRYETLNVSAIAAGAPGVVSASNLIPGVSTYVDIVSFTALQPGIHETNVVARILGAIPPGTAPHFAGFARWTYDFDPELFWGGPTPGYHYELPIKFLVYS